MLQPDKHISKNTTKASEMQLNFNDFTSINYYKIYHPFNCHKVANDTTISEII